MAVDVVAVAVVVVAVVVSKTRRERMRKTKCRPKNDKDSRFHQLYKKKRNKRMNIGGILSLIYLENECIDE